MQKKKVREPEPAQGPSKTSERVRTQRAGPDRTGPERTKPERPGPERPGRAGPACRGDAQLTVPAVRKARARSCTQERERGRGRASAPGREQQGGTARRTRSSSAAPKPPGRRTRTRTEPVQRDKGDQRVQKDQKDQGDHRDPRSSRAERSHVAFTVIPPNPKRRREIQKQAEAELAALEELRLSRATAFVSIDPSSVGGCMSLQEVRLKQQQQLKQPGGRRGRPVRSLPVWEPPDL